MTELEATDALGSRRAPFGHPVIGDRGGDTRRRIMEAAMVAIGEFGFDATRVEEIAERAGCSRPAFYQYFESKHDVFWALARQLAEARIALADQLGTVTPDAAGVAHLSQWIDAFMSLHQAWAPVFDSFQSASRNHSPQARGAGKVSVRTDAALLRAFGLTAEGLNDPLMAAMVAVLDRSAHYAERQPGTIEREPFVAALAELIHRVFAGPIEGVNLPRTQRSGRRRPAVAAPLATEREELPPRQEKTRDRLLEAGRQVLPGRGFHDTRVDDIGEAAGLSHGTFYRYFANKDALFLALTEAAAERAIALLDRLRLDAAPDDLREWCFAWMRTYQADGGITSVWQEMRANPELGRFSQQVAASMHTRLVRVLDRRPFGNPEADATSLLALLERLPNSVYTLGLTPEDAGLEVMVTILRRGYLGEG